MIVQFPKLGRMHRIVDAGDPPAELCARSVKHSRGVRIIMPAKDRVARA